MDKAHAFTLQRFEVHLRDVLTPAVYRAAAPLAVEAAQFARAVPYVEGVNALYRPVSIGWEWGPSWSTCWFRLRGRVTSGQAGQTVVVRFSSDTEALLWAPAGAAGHERWTARLPNPSGVPYHGLDVNRDAVLLFESAREGDEVELHVEAACNHLFGDRGLQWEGPEIHRRWNSATPGRLERAELAVLDRRKWHLRWLYAFALDMAKELPPESARAQQLIGTLRYVTNILDDGNVRAIDDDALRLLEGTIGARAGGSATLCHAVGHAHIDTAWLWPLCETRRKCLRTFSTVLRNMERYPEFRFLCSQAAQYQMVEEDSPALFEQIKARVAEGRWEPGGGMWVEPDCTCPSGESLIRQVLHADRYWRAKFGDERGAQTFLYLPDTFGFPASLPGIMRACGLTTFITNKLHWNQTNVFPHTTFVWRGIDGSEVLAHQTPGMDYNATNTPRELRRGEATHKNKDLGSFGWANETPALRMGAAGEHPARWLQPFGYGDGGGGPTDWSIEFARLAGDCDGMPRVRFGSAADFCLLLAKDVEALAAADRPFPRWEGELYLEAHRGTYTTHARIKQANRECEELLRAAEILTFGGYADAAHQIEVHRAAKSNLDRAWKLVLLNQFHDILPGSSITQVYDDAQRGYAEVREVARGLIDAALERIGREAGGGVVLFNSASVPVPAGSVKFESSSVHHGPIVGLACAVLDGRLNEPAPPRADAPRLDEFGVKGDLCEVEVDGWGLLARCEGLALWSALNVHTDRPRMWDAWDLDPETRERPEPLIFEPPVIDAPSDAAGASVMVRRAVTPAGSVITERLRVTVGRAWIDADLHADWRDEHRLLEATWRLNSRDLPRRAVFGTQFGWIERPVHRNTSWQRAAFEVPAHRWAALEGADSVLCVIAPDKYGWSVHPDGVLGLSLLRSPRYPDPTADVGEHRFSYSFRVLPRTENWIGEVTSEAERLCRPLIVRRVASPATATPLLAAGPRRLGGPFRLIVPPGRAVEVECVKAAEESDDLIVRLTERTGRRVEAELAWTRRVESVRALDALERESDDDGIPAAIHDAPLNRTRVNLTPFQIATIAVRLSVGETVS